MTSCPRERVIGLRLFDDFRTTMTASSSSFQPTTLSPYKTTTMTTS